MDNNNLQSNTEDAHSHTESANRSASETPTRSQSGENDPNTVDSDKNTTVRSDTHTTREHIKAEIQTTPRTASELATIVNTARSAIFGHINHIAQSVDSASDERFLLAPPTCERCGFDQFDDPLNNPSRCPECRSERISEPEFVIEPR